MADDTDKGDQEFSFVYLLYSDLNYCQNDYFSPTNHRTNIHLGHHFGKNFPRNIVDIIRDKFLKEFLVEL